MGKARTCLECPCDKYSHEPMDLDVCFNSYTGGACETPGCPCTGYNPGVAPLVVLEGESLERLAAQRYRLDKLELLDDAECPLCGSSTSCLIQVDSNNTNIIVECWACGEYEVAK